MSKVTLARVKKNSTIDEHDVLCVLRIIVCLFLIGYVGVVAP